MGNSIQKEFGGFIELKGGRENNLKNINVSIPRDALVVFTGVSGSGKSSLAFGTLYAEAQRRYLESVSPYARRLFNQMQVPDVDEVNGLPPAIALQQQRGAFSSRSSVGSVTTISNLLRMLYSRAGDYPEGLGVVHAEFFSPNTPEGACPKCHGLGRIYEVSEKLMVPDDSLTIRQRAVASWPTAWQGQNLRDILISLGYNVDIPWKELPKKQRDFILYTNEQPTVPVYPRLSPEEVPTAIAENRKPAYMGSFTGAKRYIMQTFAGTQSQLMKKKVSRFMVSEVCPLCHGKRLRREALAVSYHGMDITELSAIPVEELLVIFKQDAQKTASQDTSKAPERAVVKQRIAADLASRMQLMIDLGLGYLSLERSTPSLSPGELQRLRLATQIRSNLFGVVYVLDEPSAGLHPADTAALLKALDQLKAGGNSILVVEHETDVIRHADWIVDVGPGAGQHGGEILYSGVAEGLAGVKNSVTRRYLYDVPHLLNSQPRMADGWLKLEHVSHNNLQDINVAFPLGVLTSVTGVSGSGKSSLVSQALVTLLNDKLKASADTDDNDDTDTLLMEEQQPVAGNITEGRQLIKRLVPIDQKPIGRTPRSNFATYSGIFDSIRKRFAATPEARKRRYDAGWFSFNVAKGRCPRCKGEGQVMVELLFLPSVYTPCPECHGSRYNPKVLEVGYKEKNIAEVLDMTVEEALVFFEDDPAIARGLNVAADLGLAYLKLGQPATELSGGEAQRIKLVTELQKTQHSGTMYVLDEPTTGLHPADTDRLLRQLKNLAEAGSTVIVVEHDLQIIAQSDWVIEIGPGAGSHGGRLVAAGTPQEFMTNKSSVTAPYLKRYLKE
ncbi:excinuclease ABC subunit A [Epilithonimonas bovis DSM 19482]|uniref:UvrABC system protein A n=1 Tax=Epilithonimonas bovis DSM 19482 TaxID=1121284 RepID=A0A1U7PWK3_9FLAO|nr:excinuclease ABC subunit A [Epilithonimonas bovis DSM 19482]